MKLTASRSVADARAIALPQAGTRSGAGSAADSWPAAFAFLGCGLEDDAGTIDFVRGHCRDRRDDRRKRLGLHLWRWWRRLWFRRRFNRFWCFANRDGTVER